MQASKYGAENEQYTQFDFSPIEDLDPTISLLLIND